MHRPPIGSGVRGPFPLYHPFKGRIQEVALYGQALSVGRVASHVMIGRLRETDHAILFLLASGISSWFSGTAGGDQTSAMFGSFSIGMSGYIAVLGQVVLIAVVTALTSRQTVNRTLEMID